MTERSGWKRILIGGVVACTIVFLCADVIANKGRGRHGQLYIVPTPGEVTVDGQLDDWDLSAQIEMFVAKATRSTQNAKLAAMYDEDALYISGEVRDTTPMMNRHDPQVDPHRAWDADACQFRLSVDSDSEFPLKESQFDPDPSRNDIVHMLLWYYTDDETAHLQMQTSMSYNIPREELKPHGLVPDDEFKGVYRKWENSRGYTFEYRIPWDTLGAEQPLGAGDVVAGTVQVNWSRKDGLKTLGGSGWGYDIMRKPGFPFQSAKCWGRLIFTDEGNVPKELVMQGVPPSRPLPLEFKYELPDDGETTVQLMDQDGIVQRILVAQKQRPAGLNVENWDGMDNHALVEGHGGLLDPGKYKVMQTFNENEVRAKYRFSVHNSGNPAYRTGDGTGGWGGDHGTPQDIAAFEDGLVLSWSAAEAGHGIIRVDAKGNKVWGGSSRISPTHLATDGNLIYHETSRGKTAGVNVEVMDLENSRPTSLPDGSGSIPPPDGGEGDNQITGLACGNEILYVAYGARNLIALRDTNDGSLIETWEVREPGRMAVLEKGCLAVISEGKVVRVSEGNVTSYISSKLDEPTGLAVDSDGKVYVSNKGESRNVSVFSATGEYVKRIGKKGGRPPMGKYDPQGMYIPEGIDVGPNGRLWVAEATDFPKRISVWDVETGKNVDEFFGASGYFAYGSIDPARPDEIYAHNVLWKINWDTYETEPLLTVWRRTEPNMAPHPNVSAHSGMFRMVTAQNGRQFGFGGVPHKRVMVYIRDGDVFRPLVGMVNPWARNYPALKELKTNLTEKWDEQNLKGYKRPRDLFWQDKNADGKVAPDEVTVRSKVGRIMWLERDLTLRLSCGRKIAPRKVTDKGQPIYNLSDVEKTPLMGKTGSYSGSVFDKQGALYKVNTTSKGSKGSGVSKLNPDGELAWRYPNIIRWRDALNLPSAGPGKLWSMTDPMGVGGEYLATQTYQGVTHIFRRDGMYVGAVLGGGPKGVPVKGEGDKYKGQNEGQGGNFVKLNIDGEDRYFIIHGSHDVRVWEVLGLDTLQDLPRDTYVHTKKQRKKAKEAHKKYLAQLKGVETVKISSGRDALSDAEPVEKRVEGERGFKARMAYDEENLYVHYEVEAPHGLVNSKRDPQIIFRGGNLIDLQLATNPEAPAERKDPVPGDIRLLITRQDGKPFAVLFRPEVKEFDGEEIILDSPTGQEDFDAIEVVDWVELDYEETGIGFEATVTLPLEKIGLKLAPTKEITMDLGYIFGNSQGTDALRRVYLNNNSFTANVVDDIPHESRLEPAEWGKAVVQ